MGMFNDVRVPPEFQKCPFCGAEVDGFQTKDEDACPLTLATVEWSWVSNFYAECDECGAWVEYSLKLPTPRTVEHYELMTQAGHCLSVKCDFRAATHVVRVRFTEDGKWQNRGRFCEEHANQAAKLYKDYTVEVIPLEMILKKGE